MTTGAAYDVCQVMGWKSSLHARPTVQGFSTPPLLFLIMLMTMNRRIMGDKVNTLRSLCSAGPRLPPFSSQPLGWW
jgi:hypothetical protein